MYAPTRESHGLTRHTETGERKREIERLENEREREKPFLVQVLRTQAGLQKKNSKSTCKRESRSHAPQALRTQAGLQKKMKKINKNSESTCKRESRSHAPQSILESSSTFSIED
jgi:hypothetical protein